MMVNTIPLVALLLGASLAFAQQPSTTKEPKSVTPPATQSATTDKPAAATTLEEMLARALKDNPDIRVGEAKVREAEAELNRTRLQVLQKVVALHHALEAQRALVQSLELDYRRVAELTRQGAVGTTQIVEAQQKLAAAKAKLAEVEAEMPYLSGRLTATHAERIRSLAFSPDGKALWTESAEKGIRVWDVETGKALGENVLFRLTSAPPPQGTIAERIRKALDTPVALDFKDRSLVDILKDLQQKASGVPFLVLAPPEEKVSLHLSEAVPLGAALQALEDATGMRFGVREYGIVAAM